jgi:hypothetical protein
MFAHLTVMSLFNFNKETDLTGKVTLHVIILESLLTEETHIFIVDFQTYAYKK